VGAGVRCVAGTGRPWAGCAQPADVAAAGGAHVADGGHDHGQARMGCGGDGHMSEGSRERRVKSGVVRWWKLAIDSPAGSDGSGQVRIDPNLDLCYHVRNAT
jgi:hypothetical protein